MLSVVCMFAVSEHTQQWEQCQYCCWNVNTGIYISFQQ
jgi:hypothetical protein